MSMSAAWRTRLDQAWFARTRARALRRTSHGSSGADSAFHQADDRYYAELAAYAAHMRRVRTHQRRHRNRRTT